MLGGSEISFGQNERLISGALVNDNNMNENGNEQVKNKMRKRRR